MASPLQPLIFAFYFFLFLYHSLKNKKNDDSLIYSLKKATIRKPLCSDSIVKKATIIKEKQRFGTPPTLCCRITVN